MLINRTGGGSENLKVELNTQESLINEIIELMTFKGSPTGKIETIFGCTRCVESEFTVASSTNTSSIAVPHALGEMPKLIFMYAVDELAGVEANTVQYCLIDTTHQYAADTPSYLSFVARNGTKSEAGTTTTGSANIRTVTATDFTLSNSATYYSANTTYKVLALV